MSATTPGLCLGFRIRSCVVGSPLDGFRFYEPNCDAVLRMELGQLVEVLGDGAKFVTVLFRDDYESPCPSGDCVGQATSEMTVVATSILVVDVEL